MKPKVSFEFRKQISDLVHGPELQIGPHRMTWPRDLPLPFESVYPDVQHFRSQALELKRRSVPQFAASFRDDGPNGDPLSVLVQVPDLHNVNKSYEGLLGSLRKSELPLKEVSWESAEETFVDRLSEFLAVESSDLAHTVVNSNRQGDTVIYAKGYFISTGTAFGISNPAVSYLSAGRYSFGIMDSGNPRFDNIVWTCPTVVRLDLP